MSNEITVESLKQEIRREGIKGTSNAHKKFPLPTRVIKELFEENPETIDILFIASYPTSPSLLIEEIADEYEDLEILSAIALNPRTPQLILNRLSNHENDRIRLCIAGNRLISARDFERLISDPSETVRRALATNAGLKVYQQAQLAEDSSPAVRMALVQNKAIELPVIIKLSQDPSIVVRTHVVTKARVEDEVLFHWANSNIEDIQLALFSRRNITDNVYHLLKFSPHSSVRKLARSKAIIKDEELLWLAESETLEDKMFLLEYPSLPKIIQKILGQDPAISVRMKLSLYPHLHPDLATQIAAQGERSTCMALVNNPNLPENAILELCKNDNIELIKRLLYREDLKNSHIDLILESHPDPILWDHLALQEVHLPRINSNLANQWILSKKPSVRAMGAQAICLSDEQIATLASDPSHIVRAGVAKNPNIPPRVLIQLEDDEHKVVSESARKSMSRLNQISEQNTVMLKNNESSKPKKDSSYQLDEAVRIQPAKRNFIHQIAKLILE